jgi:hypothetical protein
VRGRTLIELNSVLGWAIMLSLATLCGAIGGFAYELLERTRSGPQGQRSDKWWVANPFLGAVAAIAILYFFPPTTITVQQLESGVNSTTYEYDLVKLIALSIIVGSAGGSILTNMQARLMAGLSEERTRTAVTVGDLQLQSTEQLADLNKDAVSSALATTLPVVRQQLADESVEIEKRAETIMEQLNSSFSLYQTLMQREAQSINLARQALNELEVASERSMAYQIIARGFRQAHNLERSERSEAERAEANERVRDKDEERDKDVKPMLPGSIGSSEEEKPPPRNQGE